MKLTKLTYWFWIRSLAPSLKRILILWEWITDKTIPTPNLRWSIISSSLKFPFVLYFLESTGPAPVSWAKCSLYAASLYLALLVRRFVFARGGLSFKLWYSSQVVHLILSGKLLTMVIIMWPDIRLQLGHHDWICPHAEELLLIFLSFLIKCCYSVRITLCLL